MNATRLEELYNRHIKPLSQEERMALVTLTMQDIALKRVTDLRALILDELEL